MDHEKLDVYHSARALAIQVDGIALALGPSRRYLCDQMRRSALSVALNIAEGAGEFSRPEKRRFYRMAKRSATETAASLDLCIGLLGESPVTREALARLAHIAAILTSLIKNLE